ncbi:anaphase-promoting complex subunit 11 isoform X2 [Hemibagrus wyckioides]|nr:anaphase-promoting complex subunit 11 isoform X2 [Hemibagrus wyckioides]
MRRVRCAETQNGEEKRISALVPHPGREMKVKIKQWHGVASWLWVANDENCGICRAPFNGCCPDCKVPGDDCPLVWGQCSHCFHMHCILKWLNSQQVQQQCPMCRQEWKFKE